MAGDDHVLCRLGFMSGAHVHNIESLVEDDVDAGGLQPGIAHFLMAAVHCHEWDVKVAKKHTEEVMHATFVAVQCRRLVSIGLDPTTVPCVVALFKSEAMARRRVALHAALGAAGLRLVELFEDGNTYPGDHVYVLLNTCSDDAVAATIAAKYSLNPVLATTVQVTLNWLTMVSPGGCCQGVGFV